MFCILLQTILNVNVLMGKILVMRCAAHGSKFYRYAEKILIKSNENKIKLYFLYKAKSKTEMFLWLIISMRIQT